MYLMIFTLSRILLLRNVYSCQNIIIHQVYIYIPGH